jgi:hypothetical protein
MIGASVLLATIFGCLPMINVKAMAAPTVHTAAREEAVAAEPEPTLPAVLLAITQCESGGRHSIRTDRLSEDQTDTMSASSRSENQFTVPTLALEVLIYLTEAGNTAYALLLYRRNGTRDCESSRSCWGQ